MAIEVGSNVIRLIGDCGHTDVEPLLDALRAHPGSRVDLTQAAHLHGAVLQLLLTLKPSILESGSNDAFIRKWLAPALGWEPTSGGGV